MEKYHHWENIKSKTKLKNCVKQNLKNMTKNG